MISQQQTTLTIPYENLGASEFLMVDYEAAILAAVDNALPNDKSTKHAIYHHLETNYGIKKAQIPLRIEAFADAVEQTFGPAAKLIEIKILENLGKSFKAFSYETKNKELFFADYMTTLLSYMETLRYPV